MYLTRIHLKIKNSNFNSHLDKLENLMENLMNMMIVIINDQIMQVN